MLAKIKGIVLNNLKYTDNSVISSIYTDEFGRQSFIFQGIRNKKSNARMNYLQPLFLIEADMIYKSKRSVQRVQSISPAYNFQSIPFDVVKSTMVLFLSELLQKTIYEEEKNTDLFNFLWNSIKILDIKEENFSNFHISFMLQLTKHLGFFPQNNHSGEKSFFDLRKGEFVSIREKQNGVLDRELSEYFSRFLAYSQNQHEDILLNSKTRIQLIEQILQFYYLHIDSMPKLNSIEVLKEVFH